MLGALIRFAAGRSAKLETRLWRRLTEPQTRLEAAARVLNAAPLPQLTRALTGAALRAPLVRRVARRWLVRAAVRPATCCEPDSCHYRFLQRYVDFAREPDRVRFIARYLARHSLERQAILLEALVRVAALVILRHAVLARRRRALGRAAPALIEVQLAPYPDCNLSCKGCYAEPARNGRSPTQAGLRDFVDQAAACGALAIHLVGKGEPFLSWTRAMDLVEVMASRPHLLFVVATNGTYFPAPLARRLATLGNVLLLVSVEGPPEVHDARRGAGSYDAARRTLQVMQEHGLLYGFTCMVGQHNVRAITEPGYLRELAAAGCVVGVYSRYFALSPDHAEELRLRPTALAHHEQAFQRAQQLGILPLVDLDEVEAHTGCRSRTGTTVYVDGVESKVAPCVRAPYAPAACQLGGAAKRELAEVLEHPFFVAYRQAGASPVSWCGEDLAAELGCVAAELEAHGVRPHELVGYRARAAGTVRDGDALAEPCLLKDIAPSTTAVELPAEDDGAASPQTSKPTANPKVEVRL